MYFENFPYIKVYMLKPVLESTTLEIPELYLDDIQNIHPILDKIDQFTTEP